MKKVYLAIVLILVFLAALVADWNIRQETVQTSAATMIRTRNDDILVIEIGYPGGTVPPGTGDAPWEEEGGRGSDTTGPHGRGIRSRSAGGPKAQGS